MRDGRKVDAKIDLFERLDIEGHIKANLLRYLDYYGDHKYN